MQVHLIQGKLVMKNKGKPHPQHTQNRKFKGIIAYWLINVFDCVANSMKR